jgi:Na+/melibiose symporter-like transporter
MLQLRRLWVRWVRFLDGPSHESEWDALEVRRWEYVGVACATGAIAAMFPPLLLLLLSGNQLARGWLIVPAITPLMILVFIGIYCRTRTRLAELKEEQSGAYLSWRSRVRTRWERGLIGLIVVLGFVALAARLLRASMP